MKKKYYFSLVIIGVASCAFLLISKPQPAATKIVESVQLATHEAFASNDGFELKNQLKQTGSDSEKSPFSDLERLQIDRWNVEKGYDRSMFPIDLEYDAYDLETLKAMIKNNNDVRAMLAFSRKEYMRRSKGYHGARYMYELAAVNGSTKAINMLAQMTYDAKIQRVRNQSDEDKRAAWKEVISLFEFAKIRGDRSYEKQMLKFYEKRFRSILSESDIAAAKESAKETYKDFQFRRSQLGLGDFDNSEPEAIKKLYNLNI